MYSRRDSKDPQPTADNSKRLGKDGGGNTPVTGEKHDSKLAERVSVASRFNNTVAGPDQPRRGDGGKDFGRGHQSGGNLPVDSEKETHDSKLAEKVSAKSRF
jgi:hypothetical protein